MARPRLNRTDQEKREQAKVRSKRYRDKIKQEKLQEWKESEKNLVRV